MLAGAGGGEDLGQGELLDAAVFLLVGDVAAELEPVDARDDREGRWPGGADDLLVGRDDPPAGEQGSNGAGHLLGAHQQDVVGGRRGVAEAEAGGRVERFALGAEVAADQPLLGAELGIGVGVVVFDGDAGLIRLGGGSVLGVGGCGGFGLGGLGRGRSGFGAGLRGGDGDEPAAAGGVDPLTGVVEPHPGNEAAAPGAGDQLGGLGRAGAEHIQVRHGVEQLLLPAHAFGQVQLGQLRQEVQPLKEARHVVHRDPQRRRAHRLVHRLGGGFDFFDLLVLISVVTELADPAVGVAVVERRGEREGESAGRGFFARALDGVGADQQAIAAAEQDLGLGDGDAFARPAELQVHEQFAGALAGDQPKLPGLVVADPAQGALVVAVVGFILVHLEEAAAGLDQPLQEHALRAGGDAVGVVPAVEAVGLAGFVLGDPGCAEHHRDELAVDGVGQLVDRVEADAQRLGLGPAGGDGGALLQVDDQAVVAVRKLGQDDVANLALGREDRHGLGGFRFALGRGGAQQRQPADPLRLGRADRACPFFALAGLGGAEAEFGQVVDRGADVHAVVFVFVEVQQRGPDVRAERAFAEGVAGALGHGVAVVLHHLDGVDRVVVLDLGPQ